ncbi:hypothetical protein [uncultured Erythrobacter sp.]|uniref:hypothetical protein n=1 Tax=uncultured Erythrobacter sp. TaxID=263913 RepID=UPI00261EBF70|nr:hypothetical protein [uncultured Erythrobacter sp.]
MKLDGSRSVLALAGLALSASALGGCSVSEPLQLRSTTSASDAARDAIVFAVADEEAGTLRGRFAGALLDAFTFRGVTPQPEARLVADFSVSKGPAEIGIQRPPAPATTLETGPDWIEPPRNSRRFDRCKAQELRGTLMLVDRQSGALVYRGTGTATECEFGEDELRALADGLVAEYLGG